MHARPVPLLCADPGWKSYTDCGKIKDNNIPFLLPQTASIFNPFLAWKTKTSSRSNASPRGLCNTRTLLHRYPRLIWL